MLTVAIWAIRQTETNGYENCDFHEAGADGYGVYIRAPHAMHVRDFLTPDWNQGDLDLLAGAKNAAFQWADALALHLRARVVTALPAPDGLVMQSGGVVATDERTPQFVSVLREARHVVAWAVERNSSGHFPGTLALCDAMLGELRRKPPLEFPLSDLLDSAATLWEAWLAIDRRDIGAIGQAGPTMPQKVVQAVRKDRHDYGVAACRQMVANWAADCHRDWITAQAEGYDDPFDWEFCPVWLEARLVVHYGLTLDAAES